MDTIELQTSLQQLRPRLVRFARLQLRNDAAAEDAVQDAMLAAFENVSRFEGAAAVATWLFAILKNKIIDEFRRRARQPVESEGDEALLEDHVNDQFNARDHWVSPVAAWNDPHASLEQKRFWEVFDACISGLPDRPARVFGMRELLGLETDEICKELGISTSNCWVLLHRARMSLRECLSNKWFDQEE
jgi:RNA polymerase sigma-70 factor (ECF subfamily)